MLKPVTANNTTGRKGKLRCMNCRKIHAKCVYGLERDTCEICTKRNLPCIKVWGPKTRGAVQIRQPRTANLAVKLPSQLALIKDSGLSDQEVFLLRYLHWEHYGKLHQCVSVILQHLWSVYGSTFVNKCLLSSMLAFGFRCYPRAQLKFGSGLYWTFVSRFQTSLLTAIRRNEISECHLFAIFLIVEGADNSDDLHVVKYHQYGFLSVLKHVMAITQNQDPDIRRSCRLHYLYNYALSLLRRMELLWVHPSPMERLSLLWEMHRAAEKLPLPEYVADIRAAMGFPARYWRRIGEEPEWQSLMWNLIDERATLYICFQRLFGQHYWGNRTDASQIVARSVGSVRERLSELLDLPTVKDLFGCVTCILKHEV